MSHDELVIEPGRDFEVENALDGTNTDFDPLMAAPPGSTIMLCGAAPARAGMVKAKIVIFVDGGCNTVATPHRVLLHNAQPTAH